MNARAYILFPGREAWRLGAGDGRAAMKLTDIAVPADAQAPAIAGAVAAALKTQGYRGEGVLLAIESSMCLCAPVHMDGLPTKQRRRAMTYRLEEKLPIAAEDVVADFIEGAAAAAAVETEALGVCVPRAALTPVVEALEESGVAVAAIGPASLLALQHLLRNEGPFASRPWPDAVVWPAENAQQLELYVLRDRRLHGWYVFPNRPKDLLMHVAMALPAAKTLAAIGLDPGVRAGLAARPELQVQELNAVAPSAAAASLAASVLEGKVVPWIDLRRDALAVGDRFRQVRAPLTVAAAAVVLCLICLCAAMLWRANRYDAMADRLADQQQAAFRAAFPTGPVPPDVRSRLEAEERRLRGLSGDDSAPPGGEGGGLTTLRDLITHLPADRDVRYRVLEVRLEQNRFALEGQATAHGDADSIVASLKRGGGFVVEPPRTEQLAAEDNASGGKKGVAFTITGTAVNGALSPAVAARGASK